MISTDITRWTVSPWPPVRYGSFARFLPEGPAPVSLREIALVRCGPPSAAELREFAAALQGRLQTP